MPYDPICGKKVSDRGSPTAEYKKKAYFFCSETCRIDFERAAVRVRMKEAARAGALLTRGRVRWGVA